MEIGVDTRQHVNIREHLTIEELKYDLALDLLGQSQCIVLWYS